MDTHINSTITPPRFEDRPEMHFAGLAERHNMKSPGGIPEQWRRFQPHLCNIDGATGEGAYGICGEFSEDGAFNYMAAVEVRPGIEAPDGLSIQSLPALRWARFTHDGDVISIRQTIGAAERWLEDNGYRPGETIRGFMEYYGPAFDTRTGSGDIEIWFGLKV